MNFASSDMSSGVQGGSNVSSACDVLDARNLAHDAVDLLRDHRPDRARHRGERVGDLHVRPVDHGVVEEPELDDVHPELRILDLPQRIDDFLLCRHARSVRTRRPTRAPVLR